MPMLDAFRFMLIYTMFDPIKITISGVLIAVGKPEMISRARLIQLLVMLAGLITLGPILEITGVALAVDLMLVVGIAVLLYYVRPFVDYSLRSLFAVPSLALISGIALNWLAGRTWDLTASDWLGLFVRSGVFVLGYLVVLFVLEGRSLYDDFMQIVSAFIGRRKSGSDAVE
jgi:O-antigen/teichoic acid export membrane protein